MTATIVTIVAYLVGFTHSWTAQALSDWRARKAQVRAQRNLFFSGFLKMVQLSIIGVVIAAVLILWVVRDQADGDRKTPMLPPQLYPAASCSAKPAAKANTDAKAVAKTKPCPVTSTRPAR